MHLIIMRHGKAVMFNTSTTGRSLMRLPMENYRADPRARKKGTMDCWEHSSSSSPSSSPQIINISSDV
ncbi:hypothetical protein E2562_014589 [Oryza meyeriana var. granulata]|uniref:Uncharacterized protein n=1 Tax=Oryza meyeriana var. granulata TaxID=110450 RepID=A0A6G1DWE5_9ORYZ|nr:hypothetical protein E2562_014589 [Oryza meyeriana var. granulata]